MGDLAAARRQYGESLQIFRALGDRQNIAMALGNLGDVATLQRDYDAAQTLHHKCLITADEVDGYIGSGEWQGKAGGYAIQGLAAGFIPWISGSYSNVVGLPLAETAALLEGAGFPERQPDRGP